MVREERYNVAYVDINNQVQDINNAFSSNNIDLKIKDIPVVNKTQQPVIDNPNKKRLKYYSTRGIDCVASEWKWYADKFNYSVSDVK